MENNMRYVHEEVVHNFRAAKEVIPFIIQLIKPKSIVDVGCGLGTWLKVFKDKGIVDILGIDGHYVDKNLLKIDLNNFIEYDLEKFYKSEKKFDLAISLEVAEHLSFESADIFVQSLVNLSDTIVFSAAIPLQGGQNHINEQEPKYWIEKFEINGYKLFDVLRPVFWDNENVDAWYRQNMFLFTKVKTLNNSLQSFESFHGKHLVHPLLFKGKDEGFMYYKSQFERISMGKKDVGFYLKLLSLALKRKFS